MRPALYITIAQERRFYRNAVQASLETFYGKPKAEATNLVRSWWTRLRATKAFESGIFLHADPVNTAANIAGVRVIAITGKNRADYHRILDNSSDLVLSKTAPLPSAAQRKKLESDRRKQLLHFGSSNGSNRGTDSRRFSNESKEKNPLKSNKSPTASLVPP